MLGKELELMLSPIINKAPYYLQRASFKD